MVANIIWTPRRDLIMNLFLSTKLNLRKMLFIMVVCLSLA